MELSEALFNLVYSVRNNIKNEIRQLDFALSPMHFKSLKVISKIEDCTGQKLAAFMGRDKAQINRLIKELVNQELIIKTENAQDKRSQFLQLSAQGSEIMKAFQKAEKQVFKRMVNNIPAPQVAEFIQLTQQFKENLK